MKWVLPPICMKLVLDSESSRSGARKVLLVLQEPPFSGGSHPLSVWCAKIGSNLSALPQSGGQSMSPAAIKYEVKVRHATTSKRSCAHRSNPRHLQVILISIYPVHSLMDGELGTRTLHPEP